MDSGVQVVNCTRVSDLSRCDSHLRHKESFMALLSLRLQISYQSTEAVRRFPITYTHLAMSVTASHGRAYVHKLTVQTWSLGITVPVLPLL